MDRPNIVYVIYHADGSVKEVQRTEYQAKKKAGEMGLDWWPCVLTKIAGNSEPVIDDCDHRLVVFNDKGEVVCDICGCITSLEGRE